MSALLSTRNPSRVQDTHYLHELFVDAAGNGRMTENERDPAHVLLRQQIGARVKQARKAAGLTGQQLADALGITYASTIYDWERGETPWDQISRLAEVLDMTPEWILHGPTALEQIRLVRDLVDELLPAVEQLASALRGLEPPEVEEGQS